MKWPAVLVFQANSSWKTSKLWYSISWTRLSHKKFTSSQQWKKCTVRHPINFEICLKKPPRLKPWSKRLWREMCQEYARYKIKSNHQLDVFSFLMISCRSPMFHWNSVCNIYQCRVSFLCQKVLFGQSCSFLTVIDRVATDLCHSFLLSLSMYL